MRMQRTQYHLILDRSEPRNPRWVIAKEYASSPANLPEGFTVPPDATWLREVGIPEFEWLRRVFGRDTHVFLTQRGQESYSTRLSHHGSVWTEYTVPVFPDDTHHVDHDHDDPGCAHPGVPAWDEVADDLDD